jgi:hypothetical protein
MALFSGAGNGKMLHFYAHGPVTGLSHLGLIAATASRYLWVYRSQAR